MTPERPDLEALINDPAVSYPLKAVLVVWWSRDPVDAANDAAVLAELMGRRAVALVGGSHVA